MAEAPIVATVTRTFDEYMTWEREAFRVRGKTPWVLLTGVPVLGALFLFTQKPIPIQHLLLLILAAGALILIFTVVLPWWFDANTRSNWEHIPALREPTTFTFDDAGVRIDTSASSTSHPWSQVQEATLIQGVVYLGLTDQTHHFIPARSFLTPAGHDRFVRLLRSKLSGCKL